MDLTRFADPAAFYARAAPFLLADEAAHLLPLGIVGGLIARPDAAAAPPYLAVVEEGGAVVAAAVMTPPQQLVLSRVAAPGALDRLADDLLAAGLAVPGAHGPVPASRDFAAVWGARTGRSWRRAMAQRAYRLDRVVPPAGVPGELRPATADDRALVVAWAVAFNAEAETVVDADRVARWAARRLDGPGSGIHLWWAGGGPVALVGYAAPTPGGIRIGPVYTPPARRRRGYAGAATAALSQLLLARGHRACFLFTDRANPTSNHIYRAIGYQPLGDLDEYRFGA